MERWRGRVALVTGASVGIGAALAVELVRLGMKVVGCARDVGKIQKLAAECQNASHPGVLVPLKCDVSKEEEILAMFAAIKKQHKGVDVCINNAGLAHAEPLLNGKTSGWKNMMDVNVLALSICAREAYQSMKERNVDDGHIININSVGGHQVYPFPDLHFYMATKFAVTALTEGLRQELRAENTHIRATSISPGLVDTEFVSRVHSDSPDKVAAVYSAFTPLKPKDIASVVTYILSAPPHVQKLAAECQSAGHPGVLVPFKCDLSKEEEILAMFAAIKEQHKGLDVCINNAGLAHPIALNGKTIGWKNMMDTPLCNPLPLYLRLSHVSQAPFKSPPLSPPPASKLWEILA
ncbi:dehydrogenase/reductase SDR family member 11-like [Pelmatolapia mariae]|uniref:dehydrogenase/reductase SDR family member 11-like n=1 Tax=Pelmatolapia mariae TaxID=158779 RepID=UPI002FE5C118